MTPDDSEVTALLEALRDGDAVAGERLFPLVYGMLHDIAARQLRGERAGHTLQPTILLHDAWLKLTSNRASPWSDRGHFYALATRVMRRLLVDHARARGAGKRRRDMVQELPDNLAATTAVDPVDMIALDQALTDLAAADDRARQVVELRFFGGLEWDEIASVVGASTSTVKRDWEFARAWLRRRMDGVTHVPADPRTSNLAPDVG